jgi:hypothetical protein
MGKIRMKDLGLEAMARLGEEGRHGLEELRPQLACLPGVIKRETSLVTTLMVQIDFIIMMTSVDRPCTIQV